MHIARPAVQCRCYAASARRADGAIPVDADGAVQRACALWPAFKVRAALRERGY